MDSEALKNKKHWNSFTSDFFVDAQTVLHTLATSGCIQVPPPPPLLPLLPHITMQYNKEKYENMLKGTMHCHKCGVELGNIPTVKAHISKCK